MGRPMTYTYDTEFVERGPDYPIMPISFGIQAEDGRSYYAIVQEANLANASGWVIDNVIIPHLPVTDEAKGWFYGLWEPESNQRWKSVDMWIPGHPDVKPRAQIRDEIYAFLRYKDYWPRLWAWYGAYDHICLCQLWGRMVDLPEGMPMFTRDLRQKWEEEGKPQVAPQEPGTEHHALWDARHDMDIAAAVNVAGDGTWCPDCDGWLSNYDSGRELHLRNAQVSHPSLIVT